jgi:hypothetical protein
MTINRFLDPWLSAETGSLLREAWFYGFLQELYAPPYTVATGRRCLHLRL